jgi:prolipoprotein diacylglyceryltransferase
MIASLGATSADTPAPLELTTSRERDNGSPVTKLQNHPSAFQTCGYVGVALASALANGLVIYQGLALWVMLALIPVATVIFLALVMATKIVVGDERIIYYHHKIAVLAGTALFLRSLHEPVLCYLDIAVLGLGIFLACGRIGCLLVGCCHGRPFSWGVRYGEKHAAQGFTSYYVGIPLFPVQALESLWVLCIVAAGTFMVIRGSASGSVFALYVVLYGLGRFFFEFLRGDPDRPYLYGLSEAQWTSLILMSLTVCGEASHRLPFRPWHSAITALIVVTVIGVAVRRHFCQTPKHRLLHPRHVREIAEAITFVMPKPPGPTDAIPHEGSEIWLSRTSLGVQISASRIRAAGRSASHYAVSRDDRTMSADSARELAKVICLLNHSNAGFELVCGNGGVFHILIPNSPLTPSWEVNPEGTVDENAPENPESCTAPPVAR